MKSNAATLAPILASDNLSFYTLMELEWNSTYRFTDLGRDVTVGGLTYYSDNPIVGIGKPRYNTTVDREAFSIQLSYLDNDMAAEINAGIMWMPVRLYLLYVVNGVPQVGAGEQLLIYEGKVAGSGSVITSDSKTVSIECTAPLSNLDERGTLFTTKDGMKLYDPTDTSFDLVYDGSDEITLKWGKI